MMKIRVPFFDTDAMGIVHHANYLKYFEMARVEWLRERGLDYKIMQARGQHLPLVRSACRYKKPARFDDILDVSIRPSIEGIRITLNYEIHNEETKELIASGSTQHVCVDNNMKVLELPNDLKNMV